jgi:integrase/recombinase XerD
VSVQNESLLELFASKPESVAGIKSGPNHVVHRRPSICRSNVTISLLRLSTGRPKSTSAVAKVFKILGIRAGLTRATPLKLRHSFATHMLGHGVEVPFIQALLEHVCLNTTKIYTHLSRKKLMQIFVRCHPHRV